jgi:prepilin-type N-terminal cleavage/methylation domain-containing protein
MLTRRRGFTLAELLIGLAILLLLGAVLLPQLVGRVRQGSAAAVAASLDAAVQGIHTFRQDVGRYPADLSLLSAMPASGARDACDGLIPPGFYERWRGPYLQRTVTASGIPIGSSTLAPALRRDPAAASPAAPAGLLLLDVAGVDSVVAAELERRFDPDYHLGAGTIRWVSAPGTGQGVLTYALPVRGC